MKKMSETFNVEEANIDRVDIVTGGDHSHGAFRFLLKTMLVLKNGEVLERQSTIGYILCKKDTGTILKNIILDGIGEGFKKIGQEGFTIVSNKGKATMIPVSLLYVTGDLTLQIILMRNDYSSGHLCIIFRLHPNVWKVF